MQVVWGATMHIVWGATVQIVQYIVSTAVSMAPQQPSSIAGNLSQKLHSATLSKRSRLQSNWSIEQVYIATDSQADVHNYNHSDHDDASPHIPHLKPGPIPTCVPPCSCHQYAHQQQIAKLVACSGCTDTIVGVMLFTQTR